MSKKLAAVRGPPRVVGVQGAALSELSSGAVSRNTCSGAQKIESAEATFFSATAAWQEQQVLNARLENEWREGQERAAKALTCLLGAGSRGEVGCLVVIGSDVGCTDSSRPHQLDYKSLETISMTESNMLTPTVPVRF